MNITTLPTLVMSVVGARILWGCFGVVVSGDGGGGVVVVVGCLSIFVSLRLYRFIPDVAILPTFRGHSGTRKRKT